MPCKDHHCVPLHEINISSFEDSLTKASKTPVFTLARVASSTLGQIRKINTVPLASWRSILVRYMCQAIYGMFFKNRGGDSTLTTSRMSHWEWLD